MKRKTAAKLAIAVGLASACADAPVGLPNAEPPPADELTLSAAVIATLAEGGIPFSEARLADLDVAIDDINTRLLPSLVDDQGTTELRVALTQLEAKLRSGDARAVVHGASGILKKLDLLAAREEFAVFSPDLDAIRAALGELQQSAAAELQRR